MFKSHVDSIIQRELAKKQNINAMKEINKIDNLSEENNKQTEDNILKSAINIMHDPNVEITEDVSNYIIEENKTVIEYDNYKLNINTSLIQGELKKYYDNINFKDTIKEVDENIIYEFTHLYKKSFRELSTEFIYDFIKTNNLEISTNYEMFEGENDILNDYYKLFEYNGNIHLIITIFPLYKVKDNFSSIIINRLNDLLSIKDINLIIYELIVEDFTSYKILK